MGDGVFRRPFRLPRTWQAAGLRTFTSGPQFLTPALFSGQVTFLPLTVAATNVLVVGPLDDADSFLPPVVGASNALTAPLLANAGEIFAPEAIPGAMVLSPALVDPTNMFFTASLSGGATATRPARGGGLYQSRDEVDEVRRRSDGSERMRRKSRRERRLADERLTAELTAVWRRVHGLPPLVADDEDVADFLARPEMREPRAMIGLVSAIEARVADEDDIEVLLTAA